MATTALPEFTNHGAVPVDSGTLLLVDPCHLPADVLRAILTPNAHGVTVAVTVQTPGGDGMYAVTGDSAGLVLEDPYASPDADCSRWSNATEDVLSIMAAQ